MRIYPLIFWSCEANAFELLVAMRFRRNQGAIFFFGWGNCRADGGVRLGPDAGRVPDSGGTV